MIAELHADGRTGTEKLIVVSRSCIGSVATFPSRPYFFIFLDIISVVHAMCSTGSRNRVAGNSVTCDLRIQKEYREMGLVMEELSNTTLTCF